MKRHSWQLSQIVKGVNHQLSTTMLNNTRRQAGKKINLRGSDRSWNTCPYFPIMSSWAAALPTERRYFSKVILASKVTPNITKSSDFFKTLFRVKSMFGVIFPTPRQEGLKGLTGEELLSIAYWPIGMTYHSFVLLAFYFTPHWSYHILTLLWSRFRH